MAGVRENPETRRLEMDEQGMTVFADYVRLPDRLVINWVESPPALRGSGAAGRFMTLVAEKARAEGLKITPVCGYAAAWLRKSRTYRDLTG